MRTPTGHILDVVTRSPSCGAEVVHEALLAIEPTPGREVLLLASSGLDELERRFEAGARPGRVVALGRVDLTRQAARWSYDEQPPNARRYDAADINRRLGILLADRARWTGWWAARSIAPMTLPFEAILADPAGSGRVLGAALGLTSAPELGPAADDPGLVDDWVSHHCRFTDRPDGEMRRRIVDLTVARSTYSLEIDPDDFVGREIVLTGRPYEADLLEHLAGRLPERGAHVLDVGAHIGNHTVALASLGHQVVAVEPNPATRQLLEANVRRNDLGDRVTVHGVAVGAANGTGRLLLNDGNSGATRIAAGPGPIPVRPIDQLVDDVDLLKLDVEGHEVEALAGAHRLLSTTRPMVLAEANDESAYRAVAGTLALYGYRSDGVSLADDPTYLFTAA
ncbi:MAG: FkbM family methyltransferase [Actinomycetota bacterium]